MRIDEAGALDAMIFSRSVISDFPIILSVAAAR